VKDAAMAKRNPLNLNPLQSKTLVLLQEMARHQDFTGPEPEPGHVLVVSMPHAHGDHFHLGEFVVHAGDATGLSNPAVLVALERKGLIKANRPSGVVLTPAGLAYDTGIADRVLHRHGH
jgi:hypothetical protein